MHINTIRKAWYFACWSEELKPDQPREVKLLGNSIAVYRASSGAVHAIGNRCPHRFAPLHRGAVQGNTLECGYHGLRFGADGKCVFSPHHNGAVPGKIGVPAYAAAERHGAIWLWASAPEMADLSRIPDLSEIERCPHTAVGRIPTMDVRASYELLIDNLFDPTHADWVHFGVLGDGLISGGRASIRQEGDMIEAEWFYEGQIIVPMLRSMAADGQSWDSWVSARWYAPSVVRFAGGIMPSGSSPEDGVLTAAYHIMVPVDDLECTYAVRTIRNNDLDNVSLTNMMVESSTYAFNHQDKPMIEAQQAMMNGQDFWGLKPALFPSDGPAVLVRRAIEGLAAAERGPGLASVRA